MLSLVLFLLATPTASATAQVANTLFINGESHPLRSEPLSGVPYGVKRRVEKDWSRTTACWAGYVTAWSIDDDQLWFLGTEECLGSKTLSADEVLEGVTDARVVADWFSGTLVLPQGELVDYVHGGWASLYREERRIVIERGQVASDGVKQLVAPGFKGWEDISLPGPLLLPADIAEAKQTLELVGDQKWLILQSAQPGRMLRIGPKVMDLEEGADVPAVLSATLTEYLGAAATGSLQHRSLEERGMIAWADRPGSDGGLVRTFAWVHRYMNSSMELVLFELYLPQSAADELDVFTRQLDLPRR